ncbi:MAG TPA: thiamine-phosphate kinase [Xanthobacteraceae bacterium]|nr:thiamine-phosphate kinase [Xanthobacteraceae bacterium]
MVERKPEPSSGEDRLIAQYFRPLATHPGALGLRDDAATITPPPGSDVVLKTDAIVGGVHFFPDDAPGMIAKKALRVNLSDLAAKGASPAGFLLSLALPKSVGDDWLAAFAAGLGEDAEAYRCPLLGGDTDRTPGPVTISIAAFGILPTGTMVRRGSARPGDLVVVTGTIGDGALGLLVRRDPDTAGRWRLDHQQRDHLIARYLLPQPRNAIAEALRQHASAGMDVSDGLVGDFGKLCAASDVGADIEVARVPLSDAARQAIAGNPSLLETALTGGDDYEVVATVPAGVRDALRAAAEAAGVALTEIGRIRPDRPGVHFLDPAGKPMLFKRPSFSHF